MIKLFQKSKQHKYKGISANCRKHPSTARCMCNRCILCIEEKTGMAIGSLSYAGHSGGLLICNDCLANRSDHELAEHYAMFSTRYWNKPVSTNEVLATLQKQPSHMTIKRYWENGQWVTERVNLDTGYKTISRRSRK